MAGAYASADDLSDDTNYETVDEYYVYNTKALSSAITGPLVPQRPTHTLAKSSANCDSELLAPSRLASDLNTKTASTNDTHSRPASASLAYNHVRVEILNAASLVYDAATATIATADTVQQGSAVAQRHSTITKTYAFRKAVIKAAVLIVVIVLLLTVFIILTVVMTLKSGKPNTSASTTTGLKQSMTDKMANIKFQPKEQQQQQQQNKQATLRVLADNVGTLYVDGVKVVEKVELLKKQTAMLNISTTSSCFAAHVKNYVSNIGLLLETSSGIVSDKSWKCVEPQEAFQTLDWTKCNFDDSSWPHAVEIYPNSGMQGYFVRENKDFSNKIMWIGVGERPYVVPQMYCRKVVKQRIS